MVLTHYPPSALGMAILMLCPAVTGYTVNSIRASTAPSLQLARRIAITSCIRYAKYPYLERENSDLLSIHTAANLPSALRLKKSR